MVERGKKKSQPRSSRGEIRNSCNFLGEIKRAAFKNHLQFSRKLGVRGGREGGGGGLGGREKTRI